MISLSLIDFIQHKEYIYFNIRFSDEINFEFSIRDIRVLKKNNIKVYRKNHDYINYRNYFDNNGKKVNKI